MKTAFKKNKKKVSAWQKTNQSIMILVYGVVLMFLWMAGYTGYFLAVSREDVINNSHNARLDSFSEKVERGRILSSDKTVLAMTQIEQDRRETRIYPYDSLFAHAVGYSTRGKTGLEAAGNFYLLSSHSNLASQVVAELSGRKTPGDQMVTTLDIELQQLASDALEDRKGAVVVMEPDTGKVLAMVSKPGFDPNKVEEEWENIISEENNQAQLLNRAAQGLYPPGSVFKIVIMLEYIREHPDDYKEYRFDCNGYFQHGEYTIQCYHGNAHGSQNLGEAFANSCNGAFASLGLELDGARLKATAEELLFNRELPVETACSKSRFSMKENASDWEILQTSIGQGTTWMTPFHSAMITAAIANGGTLMKPYLIDHVESSEGKMVKTFYPVSFGSLMTTEEAEILTEMMALVVSWGTGSAVKTDAYEAAGKTGSAQFETGKESHAWFTGFAPVKNPEIVVTVIVEEGGSGGQAAAPIARKIFDVYFSRQ